MVTQLSLIALRENSSQSTALEVGNTFIQTQRHAKQIITITLMMNKNTEPWVILSQTSNKTNS